MRILFAIIAVLFVAPVQLAKADCNDMREDWIKFSVEVKDMGAMLKSSQVPHRNSTICRALVRVMRDSALVRVELESECFEHPEQMGAYEKQAKEFGEGSASLINSYCSPADYKAEKAKGFFQ